MHIKNKKLLIILILSYTCSLFGRGPEQDVAQEEHVTIVPIGNFALPASQAPESLISFGQNIVDKGAFIPAAFVQYYSGKHRQTAIVSPGLFYATSDNSSILASLDIVAESNLDDYASTHGPALFTVQAEYALFNKVKPTNFNLFTIVANISVPIKSHIRLAPTIDPYVFLGFSWGYANPEWYVFACTGAALPFSHRTPYSTTQFLYQAGITQNLAYSSHNWVFNWMVEMDGTFLHTKVLNECTSSNANIISITPSLFFSTRHSVIQFGISAFPAQQNIEDIDRFRYGIIGLIFFTF